MLIAIQVGNEFSAVEALWSQFENVMAKDPDAAAAETTNNETGDANELEETVAADSKAH